MSERVEEIRRKYAPGSPPIESNPTTHGQSIRDISVLLAALAQAEREREDMQAFAARQSTEIVTLVGERDAARAAVERPKEAVTVFKEKIGIADEAYLQAEADLARVRAALEKAETFAREIAKRSVRDDHRRQAWAIIIEARAALGGRP